MKEQQRQFRLLEQEKFTEKFTEAIERPAYVKRGSIADIEYNFKYNQATGVALDGAAPSKTKSRSRLLAESIADADRLRSLSERAQSYDAKGGERSVGAEPTGAAQRDGGERLCAWAHASELRVSLASAACEAAREAATSAEAPLHYREAPSPRLAYLATFLQVPGFKVASGW